MREEWEYILIIVEGNLSNMFSAAHPHSVPSSGIVGTRDGGLIALYPSTKLLECRRRAAFPVLRRLNTTRLNTRDFIHWLSKHQSWHTCFYSGYITRSYMHEIELNYTVFMSYQHSVPTWFYDS